MSTVDLETIEDETLLRKMVSYLDRLPTVLLSMLTSLQDNYQINAVVHAILHTFLHRLTACIKWAIDCRVF